MGLLRFVASTWAGRAIAGLAVVAVVGAVVVAPRFGSAAPTETLRTATVTRASVTQTVAVSGSVNADEIELSFRPQGRLAEVKVNVGDTVTAGQALATLETRDLVTAVKQAQANLLSAQAKYDSTVEGVSAEDIALAKNALESATNTHDQALRTAQDDVDSAQRGLDQAARKLEDAKTTSQAGVETARQAYDKARSDYATAKTALDGAVAALRSGLRTYGAGLASARGEIATALDETAQVLQSTDTTAARTALNSADVALATAQRNLTDVVEPALDRYETALDGVAAAAASFDAAFAAGRDTVTLIAAFRSAKDAYDLAASLLGSAIGVAESGVSSALTAAQSALRSLDTLESQDRYVLDTARAAIQRLGNDLLAEQAVSTTMQSGVTGTTSAVATVADSVTGSLVAKRDAYTGAQTGSTTSVQSAADALTSAQVALAAALSGRSSTADSQRIALENAKLSFQKSTASPKQSEIALAQADVELAQIALDEAKADLDDATLKAPVAGTVASVANDVGETPASPFIVLAVTTALTLHGTVGEADIAQLKVGQVATLTVDAIGTSTRLTGKVATLDPVATIQSGVPVYGVDVTIDRPDPAIRSGMSGTATIVVASKQGVLTVPNGAVRTVNGQKVVQVVQNGVATPIRATFGISNDTVTEVTSGLEEGQVVVLPTTKTTTTTQNNPFGGQRQVEIRGP